MFDDAGRRLDAQQVQPTVVLEIVDHPLRLEYGVDPRSWSFDEYREAEGPMTEFMPS
jgi:hypothetical protein